MDKLKLRFNKNIKINEFNIKPPLVEDIIELGESKYREYLIPYTLTTEILNMDNELLKGFRNFDLFFLKNPDSTYALKSENIPLLYILIDSLKLYFQEDVSLLTAKDLKDTGVVDYGYSDNILSNITFILVENNGIIDRDNFDEIADMILKINHSQKIEVKKEPEFANDRQRDIYNKIMEGRRRKAEKDAETFADMIDVVQFGGKSFVSYEQVEKFTVPQLIHAYMTILSIDSFNINFGQYQAGVDPKSLDLDHWTRKIKQNNNL